MTKRFSVALVLVIIVGLAAGAGAGALQAKMGENGGSQLANASGQGGQTGGTTGAQSSGPAGTQGAGSRSSLGTVENVSASGFVLAAQTGRVEVTTSKDTKVTKMAEAKATDLKIGDSIVARGEQAGGILAASSIQVGALDSLQGAGGMMGGFAPGGGQRGQNQGSGSSGRPQGTPQAGAQSPAVTGTIEAIDGSNITVKLQSGSSSKLTVSSSTSVRRMADGSLSDIQTGQTVVVSGDQKSDGKIAATSVQLLPAGTMPGGR